MSRKLLREMGAYENKELDEIQASPNATAGFNLVSDVKVV